MKIRTVETLFTCYETQIANQHHINVDFNVELK